MKKATEESALFYCVRVFSQRYSEKARCLLAHCAGTGLVQLCGKWDLGGDVPEKAAFVQSSFLVDHCCSPPSTSEGVSLGTNESGKIAFSAAAICVVHSRDWGKHGVKAYENTMCKTQAQK